MVLIRNVVAGNASKKYSDLFANAELGDLMGKLESAVALSGGIMRIFKEERQKIGEDNLDYFMSELVKIDDVKQWLNKHYK